MTSSTSSQTQIKQCTSIYWPGISIHRGQYSTAENTSCLYSVILLNFLNAAGGDKAAMQCALLLTTFSSQICDRKLKSGPKTVNWRCNETSYCSKLCSNDTTFLSDTLTLHIAHWAIELDENFSVYLSSSACANVQYRHQLEGERVIINTSARANSPLFPGKTWWPKLSSQTQNDEPRCFEMQPRNKSTSFKLINC